MRNAVRALAIAGVGLVTHVGGAPGQDAMVGTPRLGDSMASSLTHHSAGSATRRSSCSAPRSEFETRRRSGFGQFFSQAEIDRRNTVHVTELIRTLLSVDVLEVHDHGGALPSYYAASRRTPQTCLMVVVLDNVILPTPFDLDQLPSPKTIAGIELYSGAATVPPIFAPYDRGCGMILIWTRSG